MNDVFNEQLVARKPNQKDLLKKVGIVGVGIILIFVALTIDFLMAFIVPVIVIVVVGVVFFMRRYNIEYEYVFTNGDLDIDRITNKSRRKQVLSISVKSFETMVPAMSKNYDNEISRFTKVFDFGSGTITDQTYIVIFEQDKERVKMIFEPNDQMFKAIRAYIPRIIKR